MKFLSLVLLLILAPFVQAQDVVQNLQDTSVTIKSATGQGSGTLYSRDGVTYVWTAGHVIDGLRRTRQVIVSGSPKTVVEFDDAQIVQEFQEDGRRIGEVKMEAQVLRYSDAEFGEDLALLRVRKKNFSQKSVTFYKSNTPPPLGTPLYHVGSLYGQFGANSLTEGIISQTGRTLNVGNQIVFDQTTVTAFPGSSGGGVYTKNGEYVGMLVRGGGETFNFIVPIRRMRAWADKAGVAWALDDKIKVTEPTVVEDTGTSFNSGKDHKKFPFLFKRESGLIDLLK